MEALDNKYLTSIQSLKSGIQNSDLLAKYLDEEEEADYQALREFFEPQISELHVKVAEENPLQLISFERELFDEGFEGLYLPRILGYSVLRGEINERLKYIRPQDHFRDVIEAICNSLNFEMLKKRIGQTIQVGFALSSDIWISNLKGQFSNKKIITFLDSQILEKYRDVANRRTGLVKFRKQFESLNYHTAEFPSDATDLLLLAPGLKTFLVYRAQKGLDNGSLIPHINNFVSNKSLRTSEQYIKVLMIVSLFYDLDANTKSAVSKAYDELRAEDPKFVDDFFAYYNLLLDEKIGLTPAMDQRMGGLISRTQDDVLTDFYNVMSVVHGKGYVHEDAIEAVRTFYDQHEGLSIYNEVLRNLISLYFESFIGNLTEESYADYFEINKTFTMYMSVFSNQEFNQNVKAISLKYIKKLIKRYTDKRGRDYQDIKKFVVTSFGDLGFMTPKQLVELFKTKRKKKV